MFSLAEFPFGLMFSNRFDLNEMFPVVGEMTIRYLAPAVGALTVEENVSEQEWQDIIGQTRANGKFKILREIAIKDQQGQTVALSKATYFSILAKK